MQLLTAYRGAGRSAHAVVVVVVPLLAVAIHGRDGSGVADVRRAAPRARRVVTRGVRSRCAASHLGCRCVRRRSTRTCTCSRRSSRAPCARDWLARNPAEGEDVRLEVRRGKEGVAGSSRAEGFIGTPCSWRVSGFRALIGSGLTRALGCCAVCGLRDGDRVKLPARTLAVVQPSGCRAPGPPTRRRRDAPGAAVRGQSCI